jgi:hypothetical protein
VVTSALGEAFDSAAGLALAGMVAFAGAKPTGFVSGDEQAQARATRTMAIVAARRVISGFPFAP